MATWNENVELAEVLIQLGLDVNEVHGVTSPRVLYFSVHLFFYEVLLHILTLGS